MYQGRKEVSSAIWLPGSTCGGSRYGCDS